MPFSRLLTLRLAAALLAALAPSTGQIPASNPGSSNSGPLPAKETLDYNVEWRLVTAGHARLEWYATAPKTHMGYEAKLHLESAGMVSRLYRVQDLYTVELTPTLCAESTVMNAQEGSRRRETRVHFNAGTRKATYVERDLIKNTIFSQKEIAIPGCVYDVMGGLFALRAIKLEPGHSTEFRMSDGKKSVSARIDAEKREDIKTEAGTFKAIRYQVYLFNDVLYRRNAHLYIWLTDDNRKVPVQIQIKMANIAIGTITFKLAKEEK